MVFGVDVFDFDFGVQINSIEQPIKSNSLGSGDMSHCRTSAFNNHLDHCFVVLNHIQQTFLMRRLDVWVNTVNSIQRVSLPWRSLTSVNDNKASRSLCSLSHVSWNRNIRSHNSREKSPSNLNLVSKEMISDSVELCETAVCFSHIQHIGSNVWHPKTHNVHPEVDFESSRSPAKSESWNSPRLHCVAVLSTWQYCLYWHVWWMCEINRSKRLSQALVHFVMDRANLFTLHRISGRPILAKYKHFRTIWEHVFDNSPTYFVSSSMKWWSSMHGVDTL